MKLAKLSIILVNVIVFYCFGLCKAEPIGMEFTYEGWLMDVNGPAEGLYDFLFTLYNNPDPNLGTQIGYINEANDLEVSNGCYAVDLDFSTGDPNIDPNIFNGDARWIEIAFRAGELNDPNEYIIISPRLKILPVPYTIYAETAGVAKSLSSGDNSNTTIVYVNNQGNVGIGTDEPEYELDIEGDMHASGALFIGEGTVGINAIPDGITSTSGNIYLGKHPPGMFNDVKIGIGTTRPGFPLNFANRYGDKISLMGDSGAHYGFGVQDNVLQIHTRLSSSDIAFGYGSSDSFTETVRFKGNGNVGIGTTYPGYKLDVRDTGSLASIHGSNSGNGEGVYGYSENGKGVKGYGAIGLYGDSDSGKGVYGKSTQGYAGYFEGPKNYFSGNVGIGTEDPGSYKLKVNGTSYFNDDIYLASGEKVDGYDISEKAPQWDSAYSWGNHANAGYLSEDHDYGREDVRVYLYEQGVKLSDRYLGKTATAADAEKLDGLDSEDFSKVGHDHNDKYISKNAGEINSASDFDFENSTKIQNLDADYLDGHNGAYYVDWDNLTGVPRGFSDGTDDGDDLGNHTANVNIRLNGHYLSGDGNNEGVYVTNNGDVGIGTDVPIAKLHVMGSIKTTQNLIVSLDTFLNGDTTVSNGYIITGTPSSSYTTGDIAATSDLIADDHVRATSGYVITGSPSSSFGAGDIAATDDLLCDDDIYVNDNIFCVTGSIFTGTPTSGHTTGDIVSTDDLVCDDDVWAGDNIHAGGNIDCSGSKNAIMQTANYGKRKLYCEEAAELFFFDRGEGQMVNGEATISLDPIFLETVTIDENHPMRVQITLTSDCNGVYVVGKTANSFTVKELMGGTSNATFDWEVAAKRKDYEDIRLEVFEEE